MTVLLFAPDGSIHSRRALAAVLAGSHQVTFVSTENPYPQGRRGFQFTQFPSSGFRFCRKVIGTKIARWFTDPLAVFRLKLLFRRVNPDVVHVCWVDHNANLCVKAKLAPLIVSVWGSDINNHFLPSHDAKARERASETLAAAAVVIVDAAGMERKCAMLAGRSVPAEMLHLGVDTERFRPGYRAEAQAWRQKLGIPENAVVLVSMRALTPIYNHDLILEAFARLTHKVDIPVVLVFKVYNMWVPASDTELRGRVERLGISASVRWLANIEFDALPEIYALADIVVNFPSMDSFPVTFAEAAACQRRVVSCRLPSYSGTFAEEYFEMVEPGDVSELSNALARAVNQVTADRNGTAPSLTKARECVEREFTEAHYSEGLDRVYARVRTMR